VSPLAKLALAFDILGHDRGASKALEDVGESSDKAGRKLSDFAGGAKIAFATVVAAGAAAAVALTKGFVDALDIGVEGDKLAAQLGLSPEQSAAFGKAAGDLYADAYGDSLGQVNAALGAVQSTLGDALGPGEDALSRTAAKALDLATAFDLDVVDAVNRAGVLLTSGLAGDADEAFDLIVASMQKMPAGLRDELGEATTEYSRFFAGLGITGVEMFDLFAQADDQFALDKTGDAIKELSIRATDMSAASVDAYHAAGLSADRMAAKILAGGDEARDGVDEIIDGLLSIKDPVKQANAAIGLFGTPLEDLGTTEIPEFLRQMQTMGDGMGDVEGAAVRMGDTLNDNAGTKIESFKRTVLQGLTDFVGISVIPRIEGLADAFGEGGLAGAVQYVGEQFPILQGPLDALSGWWDRNGDNIQIWFGDVGALLRDDVAPVLADVGRVIWDDVLPALGDLASWIVDNEFVFTTLKVAVGVLAAGYVGLAIAAGLAAAAQLLALAPFVLAAVAIGALVAATIWAEEKWGILTKAIFKGLEIFYALRNVLSDIVGFAKDAVEWLGKIAIPKAGGGGGLSGLLGTVAGGLTNPVGLAAEILAGRENGGPVLAGHPYIVGERRPELFIPDTSGTIVPNLAAVGGRGGNTYHVEMGATPTQTTEEALYSVLRSVSYLSGD